MTWLDDYTFRIGSWYREQNANAGIDVFEAVSLLTRDLILGIELEATIRSEEKHRVDADPHVFFAGSLAPVRCAMRVSPGLAAELRGREPTSEDLWAFAAHFSIRRFTYIEFPDGGLRLGEGVEVKSVVVKSGFMFNAAAPMVTPFPTAPLYDVVIGEPGVPTRNRITFGSKDPGWYAQRTLEEGDAYPIAPPPIALVERLGRPRHLIFEEIQMIAIMAIRRAMTDLSMGSAKRIPRMEPDDPWRRRDRPHARKSLFEVLELDR